MCDEDRPPQLIAEMFAKNMKSYIRIFVRKW